jgi:hypothetical protein
MPLKIASFIQKTSPFFTGLKMTQDSGRQKSYLNDINIAEYWSLLEAM